VGALPYGRVLRPHVEPSNRTGFNLSNRGNEPELESLFPLFAHVKLRARHGLVLRDTGRCAAGKPELREYKMAVYVRDDAEIRIFSAEWGELRAVISELNRRRRVLWIPGAMVLLSFVLWNGGAFLTEHEPNLPRSRHTLPFTITELFHYLSWQHTICPGSPMESRSSEF